MAADRRGFTLIELPAMRKRKGFAFTLIELLVVIAIIALLVTLLVPALSEAKRLAKVVICSTNQHAMGLGLAVYVGEEDGKGPVPAGWYGIYVTGQQIDNRENLVRIAGDNTEIYYCPLDPGGKPKDVTDPSVEYSEYFAYWPWGGGYAYSVNFFLFFHTPDQTVSSRYSYGFSYDFTHSGNPEGGMPRPLDPSSAIAADANFYIPGVDASWREPSNVAHYAQDGTHAETNVAYGDGHAETHRELEHYVVRSDGDTGPY